MSTTKAAEESAKKASDVILKVAEQQKRIYEEVSKKHKQELSKREDAISAYNDHVRDLNKQLLAATDEDTKNALQKLLNDIIIARKNAENEFFEYKKGLEHETSKILEVYQKNAYKKLSNREKQQFQKSRSEELKEKKKTLEETLALQDAQHKRLNSIINSKTTTDEQKNVARAEREQLVKDKRETRKELTSVSNEQSSAETAAENLFAMIATKSEKVQAAKEKFEESDLKAQQAKAELQNFEEANLKKLREARKNGDEETAKALEEEWKKKRELADETEKQANADKRKLKTAEKAAEKEEERQKKRDAAEKKRQELLDSFDPSKSRKQIDDNLNAIYGDQAKYLAKLEGSNEKWRKSVDNVSDAIGFSGIVSKKNVIGKMKELVDSGIAYNIEMRAFLAETSANIASTFEATNGTLLRMIRLQQQDSTAARLGMEATLTRLFNQFFEDSSYLNDVADNISSSILDASATLSRDMSLEFEYTMQKWLGSLYSLGMSSEAVQSIATGINYLGTGNVSALNGNSTLQTLLAMSASRSGGKSYAQLLTEGIDANETNKLLRAMIEYLAEIARSQGNMVTKSAYAELFGMSVTDLSSFASLTTSEIESLYNNTLSYNAMIKETETRLSQISKNMSLSDLVDTAIDNAQVGVATNIGSTAFTYGTWKALGLLEDYVGEIPIPGILAAGFGISSDIDLLNVAQTAMAGLGLLGSLLEGLGSMANGGVTNLNNWDFKESTSRGGSLVLLNGGATTNTSYSAVLGVGGATGDTVSSVSMESAKSKAYEEGGVTSEDIEEGKEIPQKIYEAIDGDKDSTVIGLLETLRSYSKSINDRLDPGRVFYTAIAGVMSKESVSALTNLDSQMKAKKYTPATENSLLPGVTSDKTTTSVNTTSSTDGGASLGLFNNLTGADSETSLMIKQAIYEALQEFAFANSLPVTLGQGYTLPTI